MFPFQKSGELSFQISNEANQQNNDIVEITSHGQPSGSTSSFGVIGWGSTDDTRDYVNSNRKGGGGRRPKKLQLAGGGEANSGGSADSSYTHEKMVVHREIERQRRQDMAMLYSSLRSLLPVDYVQGKRSISDHVTAASNYIKNLEGKVEILKEKRERLMTDDEEIPLGSSSASTSSSVEEVIVTVERFSQTIEIKISTSTIAAMDDDHHDEEAAGFPLSRVLGLVLEEGLDVVSCVSTRVNCRLIHVIHSEAINGMMSIDPDRLQQRLYGEICSN